MVPDVDAWQGTNLPVVAVKGCPFLHDRPRLPRSHHLYLDVFQLANK